MVVMRMTLVVIAILSGLQSFAEDQSASEVFDKVLAAYGSMETYQARGTIYTNIDTGGVKANMTTSFSLLLMKPNRYRISWEQKNLAMPSAGQSGAVWSDGEQPYLYMSGMAAYSEMSGDDMALGAATGISGGAAMTIPSIFLSVLEEQPAPFSRLIDPEIEMIQKIDGEDCFVIGGPSTLSKKETFWISTSRYLIKKYERSFEPPEEGLEFPEASDEELEESIRALGQEVTEESKKNMKEMMESMKSMMKNMDMKGSSIEQHTVISSPEVDDTDFSYTPPEGTVQKDSLFGELLG